jgi:hypothetical protein
VAALIRRQYGQKLTLSLIDRRLRVGNRALVKRNPPGMSLEEQEEFVASKAGRAYMQCLDDARIVVAAKFESFAWKPNFAPIIWRRSGS